MPKISSLYTFTWHPTNPDLVFTVNKDNVAFVNIRTGAVVRRTAVPGYTDFDVDNAGDNLSWKGDRTALTATRRSDGARVGFGLDLDTGRKHPDVSMAPYSSEALFRISPSGRHIQVVNSKVFLDLNGTEVADSRVSHGDWSLDEAGRDVYVGAGSGGKLVATRMEDGVTTVVAEHAGSHTAGAASRRKGWIITSTIDAAGSKWAREPYIAEIFAVRLSDGRTERIAHARTEDPTDYWAQPQATPDPTGTRILFASNWGVGSQRSTNAQSFVADISAKC